VPDAERQAVNDIAVAVRAGNLAQAEWEGERRSLDGRRLHLRFRAWQVEWVQVLSVAADLRPARRTTAMRRWQSDRRSFELNEGMFS